MIVCVDPTHSEESVMAGKLVIGVNPYREVCTLHLAGEMLIDKVTEIIIMFNVFESLFKRNDLRSNCSSMQCDASHRSVRNDVSV